MAKLKRKTPLVPRESPPMPPLCLENAGVYPPVPAPKEVIDSTAEEVPTTPELPPHKRRVTKEDLDRAYNRAKEKQAKDKAEHGDKITPPFSPEELTSETVIDGKRLEEWHAAAVEDALVELPGWASWGLRQWKANGSPTPAHKVLDEITSLREEAEKQITFAHLDREKATKTKDEKKAAKLLEAAQKKSDKAAKLFAEADSIAAKYKGEQNATQGVDAGGF